MSYGIMHSVESTAMHRSIDQAGVLEGTQENLVQILAGDIHKRIGPGP